MTCTRAAGGEPTTTPLSPASSSTDPGGSLQPGRAPARLEGRLPTERTAACNSFLPTTPTRCPHRPILELRVVLAPPAPLATSLAALSVNLQ